MANSEAQPEPDDMIICRDVHKWYGEYHALRGISASIKRREVVVVFGPSGLWEIDFHPHH